MLDVNCKTDAYILYAGCNHSPSFLLKHFTSHFYRICHFHSKDITAITRNIYVGYKLVPAQYHSDNGLEWSLSAEKNITCILQALSMDFFQCDLQLHSDIWILKIL